MKIWKVTLLVIVVVLISARIALPYVLLNYVKKQINKIPEYHAAIDDLYVHLYRGSYTLSNIQLWKINKNIPVPYFKSETIDFSIEWKSLLHGKVVAKIIAQSPVINLVTDPGKNEQITISSKWLDIVKSLYPLNINRLEVNNGEINFRSFKGNPPFKSYIKNISFVMQNMQNAERKDQLLSSSFQFSGVPMGSGNIDILGNFNPFAKSPTFDLNAKLTSLSIQSIKNLLKHYTNVDVIGGTFSLYGEAAAANGKITGYAKPFIKNLKIGAPKNGSPIAAVVDGLATVASKVLENSKQKTIATKINISGNVDEPDTSTLSVIGYLLRHAFIQALLPKIDNSVEMEDIYYGKASGKKSSNHKPFPVYRN